MVRGDLTAKPNNFKQMEMVCIINRCTCAIDPKIILCTEYGQRSKRSIQVVSVKVLFSDILPGRIHAALDASPELHGNGLAWTAVVQ